MGKAELTKEYIIEKTAPIFNTKGYAGTSINDMTEATGLTKGSIYGNFANKDEVAVAAFEFNLKKVEAILRAEISKEQSMKDKLLVYTKVYENFHKEPFPFGGCPVLNTAVEADDTHPLLKAKASEAIIAWKNNIVKMIEKGKANGEFRNEVNGELVAVTMISMIEGAIMITKLTGKINYRKLVMQSVVQLIEELT